MHKILIPILAKLCQEKPTMWYKHVDAVQRIINNTAPRSTHLSPFRIMTGLNMRINDSLDIQEMLREELITDLDDVRDNLRLQAKESILKIQAENRRTFNSNRKPATTYKVGDLVAIKKTQFGTGMKLRPKFFGPYRVRTILTRDRLEVEKVGDHEGPNQTISVAQYTKPWC